MTEGFLSISGYTLARTVVLITVPCVRKPYRIPKKATGMTQGLPGKNF